MTLSLPLLIFEDFDLCLYESLEDAMMNLEPIDVSDGVCLGFDARGRRLEIQTDGTSILIGARESEPTHEGDLRNLLKKVLELSNDREASQHDDLDILVRACRNFTFQPRQQNLWGISGMGKAPS